MYGNKIGPSEWHPEVSVIGEIDRSQSGNVVLRIGRIWTDNPERGWQQTEHVVLTRNEVSRFLREVVEVMEPTKADTLTLQLDQWLAQELLDKIVNDPLNESSESFARLWEHIADFVHANQEGES
jgi:hypothetical protein